MTLLQRFAHSTLLKISAASAGPSAQRYEDLAGQGQPEPVAVAVAVVVVWGNYHSDYAVRCQHGLELVS